ncbi:hypothetical protein PFISCL1PPCAC_17620, partial [Pristionchus fissidentatus]
RWVMLMYTRGKVEDQLTIENVTDKEKELIRAFIRERITSIFHEERNADVDEYRVYLSGLVFYRLDVCPVFLEFAETPRLRESFTKITRRIPWIEYTMRLNIQGKLKGNPVSQGVRRNTLHFANMS